jgi:hypothetical protein
MVRTPCALPPPCGSSIAGRRKSRRRTRRPAVQHRSLFTTFCAETFWWSMAGRGSRSNRWFRESWVAGRTRRSPPGKHGGRDEDQDSPARLSSDGGGENARAAAARVRSRSIRRECRRCRRPVLGRRRHRRRCRQALQNPSGPAARREGRRNGQRPFGRHRPRGRPRCALGGSRARAGSRVCRRPASPARRPKDQTMSRTFSTESGPPCEQRRGRKVIIPEGT